MEIDRFISERKNDIIVFACLFFVYLYIYGGVFSYLSYNSDEMLDFYGYGTYTYLAFGRWGLAAWRLLVGEGPATWTVGITAGIFLVASILVQVRILKLSNTLMQIVYGVLYLSVFQFAWQLSYSMQGDAVAGAMLSVSIAAYLTLFSGKYIVRCISAVCFLTFGIAVYQNLFLNYVILILLFLLRNMISRENRFLWGTLFLSGIICGISLVLWLLVKFLILYFADIPESVILYCNGYNSAMIGWGGTIVQMLLCIGHCFKEMCFMAAWPNSYDGEWIYAFSLIPLLIFFVIVLRLKTTCFFKAIAIFFSVVVYLLPFVLILILCKVWPLRPWVRVSEPLAFAGIWSLVLPSIWKQLTQWRCFVAILLILFTVRAGIWVSRYADSEKLKYDAVTSRMLQIEFDGLRAAAEMGVHVSKGDILVFSNVKNVLENPRYSNEPYYFDWAVLPLFRYLKIATHPSEYREHEEVLKDMPKWPAKGSIRESKGVIIISN